MKQSHLFCCIPIMCLVTLLGVATLIKTNSLSTLLTPISIRIGVLKDGSRTTHLKRKIKKIRVKLLPSGNLVDMEGNTVPPETLAAKFNQKNNRTNQAALDLGSVPINKQENVYESSPLTNLQTGLSVETPTEYSRTSLGSKSNIGTNKAIVTVTQEQKDIKTFSQNPDINKRGKWQREQVDKYCTKHGRDQLALTLPRSTRSGITERRNLFRHLIFDDKRKLIFCFIPKVGCTNMRRFLFVLQGAIPKETVTWKHVSEEEFLGPGVHRASFLNYSLTDPQRFDKIKNYWKFMIVRNPLERLLSAFINKLASPLKNSSKVMDMFELHKRSIMEKYHPEKLKQWRRGNQMERVQLDYETYLQWIIDTPNHKLNEHFAPIIELAQPCRIRYHFYGNFKIYASDMEAIIAKLGAPKDWYINRSNHKQGRETSDKMIPFYSTVRREVKEKLIRDISDDLEFYYTLYPEEKDSMNAILGLSEAD